MPYVSLPFLPCVDDSDYLLTGALFVPFMTLGAKVYRVHLELYRTT